MSHDVKSQTGTYKGYALVRDKNGKPKIDDWENCPIEIKQMLTESERKFFEMRK